MLSRSSTAVGEVGQSSDSNGIVDVEGRLVQLNIEQHQDEDVRREIRQKLRNLQQETARNRTGLVSGSAKRLTSTLENVNRIFQDIRHNREAALDAQLVSTIAQTGRDNVQLFATGLARMNSIQFVEKLVTFIGGSAIDHSGEPFRISREGWLELGRGCSQYFKHSPSLHFMFGSFSRDPPEVKKRERKIFPKDNDNLKPAIAPKQVISLQELGKKESTTVEVERIYEILKQLYGRDNENCPICYFEFVTNPDSFSQTIENMFHTSFLVRDGLCRIQLDSDRLPTIVPVEMCDRYQSICEMPNHQVVIPMTHLEWKNVVHTFDIKEPLIPTRKHRKLFENTNMQSSCSYFCESKSQNSSSMKLNAKETKPSSTQINKGFGSRRRATSGIETDSD